MKKQIVFIFTTLLFYAVFCGLIYADEASEKTPNISFTETTFDFGSVYQGEKVEHIFKFKNTGDGELIIDRVRASCGCTAAILSDTALPSDEEGEIEVTFNSAGYVGRIAQSISVQSNDPLNPTVVFKITGEVKVEIEVKPTSVQFGNIQQNTRAVSRLEIIQRGDEELLIDKITTDKSYIKIDSFEKREQRGKNIYSLDVALTPEAPEGRFIGRLEVLTNSKRRPRVLIGAQGNILPAASKQNNKNEIQIGYFYERGCLDCDKAHDVLQSLKTEFPAIVVIEYDITTRENMQLNETLCQLYGVPEEKRLIAPTIFIGKNYVIGKGITKEKVVELIGKYPKGATLPLEDVVESGDIAENSIAARFQQFGIFAIIAAGLLDGVNPCAFATIIFFISYLTILKRKGREIILVGIAFTSSIFITYFLIGVGLFEFLKHMTFLKHFIRILYALVAALTFFLGIFSFIDFIKCRRGKPTQSILQLPRFLKDKIHSTIREKAGFKRYIFAAFIIGFIISVLELACTGQVYLPTIVYATGISDLKFSAYTYLLLYNLMFIIPLIVIFISAYFGAKAIHLSDTLGRSMALIKLLLSVLFFIFTAFLVTLII